MAAALVAKQYGTFIVLRIRGFIRKSSKNLTEFRELFAALISGEQFLPNKANDFCAAFVNECGKSPTMVLSETPRLRVARRSARDHTEVSTRTFTNAF